MNKLYSLCEKNNIKLSIAVYPWPAQILYDDVNSIQVGIWKKFCKNKCYRFINNFETFFSILGDKDPDSFIDEFYNDGDVHFNEKGHKIIAKKFIEVF